MKFIDVRHPFFNPLWRRVATVGVTGIWALFELLTGSVGWAILFGAIAAWCAYEFFVTWQPQPKEDKE